MGTQLQVITSFTQGLGILASPLIHSTLKGIDNAMFLDNVYLYVLYSLADFKANIRHIWILL